VTIHLYLSRVFN